MTPDRWTESAAFTTPEEGVDSLAISGGDEATPRTGRTEQPADDDWPEDYLSTCPHNHT